MPRPANHITLLFTACLLIITNSLPAQPKRTKIIVDKQLKDTFSFTKQWAYYWEVTKDDNGKFTKTDGAAITPADTAHLYFTANCTTNIQGGYAIRYCYAQKIGNTITLLFADGSPAYGSEFNCYIKQDSFYFKPAVNYPLYIPGEHISYGVTHQQLIINKLTYAIGDTLTGYINAEFTETASAPRHTTQKTKLYLRGYIKAPVTGEVPYRR